MTYDISDLTAKAANEPSKTLTAEQRAELLPVVKELRLKGKSWKEVQEFMKTNAALEYSTAYWSGFIPSEKPKKTRAPKAAPATDPKSTESKAAKASKQ